jgi:putative phosphotransacetylase
MTEEQIVQVIAGEVVRRIVGAPGTGRKLIEANVSARHIHLSPAHVEALFGKGHQLTKLRELKQTGQFACQETVAVIGERGSFPTVRVLGPARGDTQVEVSLTDARTLGLAVPIRLSGRIDGTPGITLEGPQGRITIPRGVIVAARHIHLHPVDAERLGLKHEQTVRVRTAGGRPLTFDDVVVRVSDRFVAEMHLDTDEANAGAISDGDMVEIVG